MSKYSIYIICKDEEIFNERVKSMEKYNKKICKFYWIPAVFLKRTPCNTGLTKKLDTRYNTTTKSRLNKLGAISAHRNALLSIINNNTHNNLILEEDATLVHPLPNPPNTTCYLGGWIIPPQITKAGKEKVKIPNLKNGLNNIDYDKFKVLMAHAYFIKTVSEAHELLKSTLEPAKLKNYDVHLIDNEIIKKFYYPAIFVQSRHKSEIEGRVNKNDINTINYGL